MIFGIMILVYHKGLLSGAVGKVLTHLLRLDYGGLGQFCRAQVNFFFFSFLLIPLEELYII